MTVTVEAARSGWAVRVQLPVETVLFPFSDLAVEFDGDDRWDADIAELAEAQREVRTCQVGDFRDLLEDGEGGTWESVTDAALARRDDAFRPFAEVIAPLPTLDLTPAEARQMAHALLLAAEEVSPSPFTRMTAKEAVA